MRCAKSLPAPRTTPRNAVSSRSISTIPANALTMGPSFTFISPWARPFCRGIVRRAPGMHRVTVSRSAKRRHVSTCEQGTVNNSSSSTPLLSTADHCSCVMLSGGRASPSPRPFSALGPTLSPPCGERVPSRSAARRVRGEGRVVVILGFVLRRAGRVRADGTKPRACSRGM